MNISLLLTTKKKTKRRKERENNQFPIRNKYNLEKPDMGFSGYLLYTWDTWDRFTGGESK
jgi:hypothetical protein